MFMSVRKYQNAKSVSEIQQRVEAEFVPMIQQVPGFQGYYALDCGDDCVASVSMFDTRESAMLSNEKAREWVRDRLSDLLPDAPDTFSGEVIAHTPGSAQAAA